MGIHDFRKGGGGLGNCLITSLKMALVRRLLK